jgi:hypothetical protein
MRLNETYSKVRRGQNLSDSVPILNGPKQWSALSALLFNSTLEYAIEKFQVNQMGLKLNGTYKLQAYADDVSLLRDNVNTLK